MLNYRVPFVRKELVFLSLQSLPEQLSGQSPPMFRAARLLRAVVFLASCATFATATCYTPDGSAVPGDAVAPCSSDPSNPLSHVCCMVNRPKAPGTSTNASEVRDACLPNGLCQNESLLEDGSVFLQWGRNWCTSRDWSTGQCLDNVCTSTADDVGTATDAHKMRSSHRIESGL
jgi:hypothetical protein